MLGRFIPALLLLLAACAPQLHAPQPSAAPPAAAPQAAAPATPPVAAAPNAQEPAWPFEKSDLPVDPAFRFGQLDNGMRYIVRHNETPPGQGEVRLLVDSGSLSEHPDELGYAHFIEHMAFNGSTHVPEGEMVKLLEREGLAFGADTNASTSFDSTIYKLNLPRSDPELLGTALMLMRETASELAFTPDAVNRERGVVLSEKRVRDTYALRDMVDSLDFFYPGSLFAERMPIGTAEALNAATPAKLRALYKRIYTPRNSTLIVVGDFNPDQVVAQIRQRFSDWQTAAPVPEPDAGPVDPALAGKTDIYIDPALSERTTASRNGPWLDEPDTVENRRIGLLRSIGYGIVNRRFQRLANGENPPFRGAGLGTGDVFKVGRTTNLVVDTGDGEWRTGLAAAVAEYRRAMTYGFSQAEVNEQLANIRTGLENAVASSSTRSNSALTSAAISLIEDEEVPTTPESALERFNSYVDQITPDAVMAALRQEAIPLDDPLLRFEGRTAPQGGEAALRAAWNEAMAAPIEQTAGLDTGAFGYTDFGTPGKVVADSVDPKLGIREIRFANGLRLNLKRTELKRDRISFKLNIDGGDMLDTKSDPLATAMTSMLPMGGLGKHSFDELQTILAGRSVDFSIRSRNDTFEMGGTTTPRDLQLQLELLAAADSDPGYRPQGELQYRRDIANYFARKNATPNSALGSVIGGVISDGDPRFTLQNENDYLALTFDKLRQDIGGRLAHGAMELALVGDLNEQETIDLVARTLGALPPREPDFLPYPDGRQRGFTSDRQPRTIYHTGEQDQALLSMTWPTRDDSDPVESMKLELLEQVVRLELIDVLREKLGQTYSPSVNAYQSRDYRNFGTFGISAALDVADVAAARTAIVETLTTLRSAPIDDDTMLRARRPMIERLQNMLKTNEGWMSLVDRAQSEPDQIDRYQNAISVLSSVTAGDLQTEADKYLDPAKRVEIVVLPEAKSLPTHGNGEE